jgi:hypothetical protein
MDWIELAPDRDRRRALVNAVMNLWVALNVENSFTSCKPVGISRRTLLRGVSKLEKGNISAYSVTLQAIILHKRQRCFHSG